MRKLTVVLGVSVALVAAACGASGEEGTNTTEAEGGQTTEAGGGATGSEIAFEGIEGVCSDGDATVDPAEAGKGADKLYIGVATDRNSDIRPGLNKEMWDASVAFKEWCNAQGGIQGLPIELVELDAALLQVERAMTTACAEVFAMVGGGLAQDNLQFSGKDGSDFHACKMVDIPGYLVSPQKSDSNGQVQSVPNKGTAIQTTWIQDYANLYPEQAESAVIVYADLPALVIQRKKYEAALEAVGIELAGTYPYPVTGLSDWTPLAQSVIDSGAQTLMFVGEPTNLANLLAKLREQGWEGVPLLETNMYDPLLFSAGTTGPEGAVVRLAHHPLEEADQWPGIAAYQALLEQYVPDAKQSSLGLQALSAWLLFATAANACAESNDGVLTRTCVLEQAAAVEDWTGGGIFSVQDPEGVEQMSPGVCSMLVVVKDGKFERLYPEVGSSDDDGEGFSCQEDGVAEVPANEGLGKIDPSRPI